MLKHILTFIILLLIIPVYSQLYTLQLTAPENKIISQWLHTQPPSQDSISWILARNNLFQTLHSEGYLLADLNEWQFEGNSIHAAIDPDIQSTGQRFHSEASNSFLHSGFRALMFQVVLLNMMHGRQRSIAFSKAHNLKDIFCRLSIRSIRSSA